MTRKKCKKRFIRSISFGLCVILLVTTINPNFVRAGEIVQEQSEVVPEQSETPPEQSEVVPEQSETPPEQAEVVPEQSETPQEQSESPQEQSETPQGADNGAPKAASTNNILEVAPSDAILPQNVGANYPDVKPGETAKVDRVYIDGVEFTFDKAYTVGRYVTGDYWVYGNWGTVTINNITPAYDNTTQSNGWEVNPRVTGGQGFVGGENTGFDETLIPTFPYKSRGTNSIVKTISVGGANPQIKTAVVLTAVEFMPADNGARTFRPAYSRGSKISYTLDILKTDLLPNSYAPVANTPSIESLTEAFSKVRLEHKSGDMRRILCSLHTVADEKAYNEEITAAAYRLMMTDSIEDKMPLLIPYLQYGIDRLWTALDARETWESEGAEPLHLLPAAFTTVMLDCRNGKRELPKAEYFTGTKYFYINEDEFTLFGSDANLINSVKDPYGQIDGGIPTDGVKQAYLSEAQKSEILATHMMPALKNAWPIDEWDRMRAYVDRWEYFGIWTLPDTGVAGNRFAVAHRTNGIVSDTDNPYQSNFTDAMWTAYRTSVNGAKTTVPYAEIINLPTGSVVKGTRTLQTSAYGIHGVASVQYRLDYSLLGEPVSVAQATSPYAYELTVDFTQIETGMHTLYAIVTDLEGNTYQSQGIDFHVEGGTGVTGLIPDIEVRPGNQVRVNEEVFFTAEGSTYTDMKELGKARFTWDFGDGYQLNAKPELKIDDSGNAVTHYYMCPGTYVVTLTITMYSKYDDNMVPIGNIVNQKKKQITITVEGESPMEDYELLHAPFTARIAQFITATIPASITSDSKNRLEVTLIGENHKSNQTILSKTNLQSEEEFLLDQSELPADNYTIRAQLYDRDHNRIEGGLWEEYYVKSYDGIPQVGINEWNSICVDGELYFPVTPFMLNCEKFDLFEGTINTTYQIGYYNEAPNHNHYPELWEDYLEQGAKRGWMGIGPGRGDYSFMSARNKKISRMQEFAEISRSNSSMLFYDWTDEPNLGGRNIMVPAPVLAAWNYATHEIDDQHPLAVNLVSNTDNDLIYSYKGSNRYSDRHFFYSEVILFDMYPLEQRTHPRLHNKDKGIMELWVDEIEEYKDGNMNLLPTGCFVEVCNIFGGENDNPAPTGSQVLMEAWLATVHGVKMINWFPYFLYDTIQYDAMREFMTGIETFDQIILGPDLSEDELVTDDSNIRNNRVDTMTKKDGDDIYLFTVRLTEPEPLASETKHIAAYDENKIITTTFTIPNITSGTATVLDASGKEVETIIVSNGQFSDTYAKEEYRIYRIESEVEIPPVPGDMNNDRIVDIVDLAYIARHIDKTSASTDWSTVKKADMNNDGKINIVDLSTVARLIQ